MRRLKHPRRMRIVRAAWIVSLILASGALWASETTAHAARSRQTTPSQAGIGLPMPQLSPLKAKLDMPTLAKSAMNRDKSAKAVKPTLTTSASSPKRETGSTGAVWVSAVKRPEPVEGRESKSRILRQAQDARRDVRLVVARSAASTKPRSEPKGSLSSNPRRLTAKRPRGESPFRSEKVADGYALFNHRDEVVPKKESRSNVTWASAFGIMARLIIVAILAYCSLLGLKWLMNHRRGAHAVGNALSLAGTVSLGANKSVYVIRAGGKDFLIGAAGNSINLLAELGESLEAEAQDEPVSFERLMKSYAVSGRGAAAKAVVYKLHDAAASLGRKAESLRRAKTGERSEE